MRNIVGNRYGRLVVIKELGDGNVLCKCDCGNFHTVKKHNLIYDSSGTKSCGCYGREIRSKVGSVFGCKNMEKANEINKKYGTNVFRILKKSISKANRSGYTGVWYNGKTGKYVAYISFRGKRHYLGSYPNISDAVAARTSAENEFYEPILDAKIR